jgi:hypothetical protein
MGVLIIGARLTALTAGTVAYLIDLIVRNITTMISREIFEEMTT